MVKSIRKEEPEVDIGAVFKLVGGKVPPSVEKSKKDRRCRGGA